MNPVQNRTGSASARSHDNQNVLPGGRAAAQSAISTLLPAPAEPTTTVSRWPAPAASRPCNTDRRTSVDGSPAGRNFINANRTPEGASRLLVARVTVLRSTCPGGTTGRCPLTACGALRCYSHGAGGQETGHHPWWGILAGA